MGSASVEGSVGSVCLRRGLLSGVEDEGLLFCEGSCEAEAQVGCLQGHFNITGGIVIFLNHSK